MDKIELQIYTIICKKLRIKKRDIDPGAPWDSYGFDSLALVEMIAELCDHFKIQPDVDKMLDTVTVKDFVNYIRKEVRKTDSGHG